MAIARVFRSGRGQAIQLPKEFSLQGEEVEIFRRGEEIIVRDDKARMTRAFQILTELPSEGIRRKGKDLPQRRRGL